MAIKPHGAAALLLFASQASGSDELMVGNFSMANPGVDIPAQWEPLNFEKIPRHSRYTLVYEKGITVIKADSQGAASGLIRRIQIDPERYPLVQWRWKVSNTLEKSNVYSKAGDDYPARLYITFAYDPDRLSLLEKLKYQTARMLYGDIPSAAINYIWATNAPVGALVDNAYTSYTKMFVVQSGAKHVGEWIVEERNILQDYIRAFGERPPMISGVAIMTDTDNTGGHATAYYGDIVFKTSQDRERQ